MLHWPCHAMPGSHQRRAVKAGDVCFVQLVLCNNRKGKNRQVVQRARGMSCRVLPAWGRWHGWHGKRVPAPRHGWAWLGLAWHGKCSAWQDTAWHGMAGHGWCKHEHGERNACHDQCCWPVRAMARSVLPASSKLSRTPTCIHAQHSRLSSKSQHQERVMCVHVRPAMQDDSK